METLDLLNMSSKEMIALMRKEIEQIVEMRTEPMEYIYIENKETKEKEKVLVKSSELVLKALSDKRQRNVTSKTYKLITDDILSYSEANNYNTSGNKIIVKHTKKYNEYAKIIKDFYDENNKDNLLEYFLKQEKIMIIIEFSLKNIQKDNDNVTKPFLDCLFFNVDKRDNRVKRIYSSVKKSISGKDEVKFQVIKLTESNWENGIFESDYEDHFHYESIF